jgi:hypothetical protein
MRSPIGMARAGIVYMADVPSTTQVYLERPEFGVPETPPEHKGRPYSQPLALTILASWFVAQTKLRWAQQYPRDPELYHQSEVDLLPTLSVTNVRELLRAVMPVPQLSRQQAADQVVKHLINRTRSRKSRVKKRRSRAAHSARDPA